MVVEDTIERVREIEEICGITRNFVSPPNGFQVADIPGAIAAATQLRKDWNMGDVAIAHVINMLEDKGVIDVEVEASDAFSGLNGTLDNGIPVIVVNGLMAAERKRFTALHELGHVLLRFADGIDEKTEELLCNIFANEALLPGDVFVRLLGEKRHDIALVELKNLQAEYGISVDALMYKARYLNIISENRHTTYWKRKNTDAAFSSQVERSVFDEERSTKFENLVYRALSCELITESKAAILLNISTEELVRNRLPKGFVP